MRSLCSTSVLCRVFPWRQDNRRNRVLCVCRKAEQIFETNETWNAVHERDRREIYDDAIVQLAKREKVRMRTATRSLCVSFSNSSAEMHKIGDFSLIVFCCKK